MSLSVSVEAGAPPFVRVVVALTSPPASWTLERVVDVSHAAVVRGGRHRADAGTVLDDTEAPFGTPLTYRIVDDDTGAIVDTSSPPVVLTAPGYVWLTSPVSLDGAAVEAEEWPELEYPFTGGIFRPVGRRGAVVVRGPRGLGEGDLVVTTDTAGERSELLGLLNDVSVVQLRAVCPEVWAGYWAVEDLVESRVSNAGDDPRRRFTLRMLGVDRPDVDQRASTDTLADLHASLGGDSSGTLLGLSQTFPGTLLDVAAARLSSLAGGP